MIHPQNVYSYENVDLFDMAAAYAFHLAQAQAFLDGNKRVGAAAALLFLELNDITLPAVTDELHRAMTAISARTMDRSGLANVLRQAASEK